MEKRLEKFNNETAKNFLAKLLKLALGAKEKVSFGFGYKGNLEVCMKLGFITKCDCYANSVTVGKALMGVS